MNCVKLSVPLVFKGSNLGEDNTGWNGTEMFKGCEKIPSADLSESTITALRRDAFANCTSLKEVKLPPTFAEFGNPKATSGGTGEHYPNINTNPFGGCSGIKLYLNSAKMPVKNMTDHVETPMDIATVSEIVIGTNMTELEDGAFPKVEYSGLTKITFLGAKPATVGADPFRRSVGRTDYRVCSEQGACLLEAARDGSDHHQERRRVGFRNRAADPLL